MRGVLKASIEVRLSPWYFVLEVPIVSFCDVGLRGSVFRFASLCPSSGLDKVFKHHTSFSIKLSQSKSLYYLELNLGSLKRQAIMYELFHLNEYNESYLWTKFPCFVSKGQFYRENSSKQFKFEWVYIAMLKSTYFLATILSSVWLFCWLFITFWLSWKMVQSLKTKHCGHCTIVNSASASLGANKVDIKSGNVAIFMANH